VRGRDAGAGKFLAAVGFLPKAFNPRTIRLESVPAAAKSNTQAARGNCAFKLPPKKTRGSGCRFCKKKTTIPAIARTKINNRISA
jgi:hypothetical protein